MKAEFEKIAAYESEDYLVAWQRLCQNKELQAIAQSFGLSSSQLKQINNREQLDQIIIMPLVEKIIHDTSKGAVLDYSQIEGCASNMLFLTNHRDIILDSAILATLLYRNLKERIYIGIGTNLYVKEWIEDAVRLCMSFSVIRGGSVREVMFNSQRLSQYINYLITDQHHSVWLAQREGRAKDSNDRTQPALLKMLTMAGEGSFINRIKALNITPVALCYEYDPCDYLKAQEFQLKRDNPDFKKTKEDDYLNMKTGLTGYKGQIVFRISKPINDELQQIEQATSIRNEQVDKVAELIDKHIHSNYHIFNTNRIACDLLQNTNQYQTQYTEQEKIDFENYIEKQINRIEIENKDHDFLRHKILEMYANPLINHELSKK